MKKTIWICLLFAGIVVGIYMMGEADGRFSCDIPEWTWKMLEERGVEYVHIGHIDADEGVCAIQVDWKDGHTECLLD